MSVTLPHIKLMTPYVSASQPIKGSAIKLNLSKNSYPHPVLVREVLRREHAIISDIECSDSAPAAILRSRKTGPYVLRTRLHR